MDLEESVFDVESIEAENTDVLFDQIMTNYGQDILQLVYSYVRNKTIAEDLTQEIFVKCYRSLHKFERKSKIRTWLYRIAINHCKDYLKSWYFRKVHLTEIGVIHRESLDKQVEQVIVQKDDKSELVEAILQLPLKYREAIYLYYFEDLSLKEIEVLTDINQNTIKTRLRRAKELLKNVLEG
ncbi:sigma-70 family RNA polymerase sigma factor [Fictibacillus gelatini]|uniref:sigma-70 family RNA polymerase sigma factor n=1 Tax=Fictibacillus gelatini TaxID=225985 RepID=UPI0009D6AF3B|nr:sigma-70 family RNA polymerase sigma factor [Fictibacillus gelatini]